MKFLRWLSLFLISPRAENVSGSGAGAEANNLNHHWQPTPFPVSFQVSFVTNITFNYYDNTTTVGGKLYYDWTLKRQRVDHEAGSYECVHFYNNTQPCSLYFLDQGMYRVLRGSDASDQPKCCLDLAGVGTPPPTWASDAKPTFHGMVHDEFTGLFAYQWIFDHLELQSSIPGNIASAKTDLQYHTTRQVALPKKDAGKPLVFTFPGKALGTQDYHYQVDTMVEGPQDPTLFQLPQGCINITCKVAAETE